MSSRFPSMKWLEAFAAFAQSGSIKDTAHALGVSDSTISHQLQCLQDHVGVALIDHTSRPMALTLRGIVYLRHAEEALSQLERVQSDLTAASPLYISQLRLGMIEDFESDIGPEISRMLAGLLPACKFTHYTRASRDILELLHHRELDIGISMQPTTPLAKVEEHALLRDPFVLAVPASTAFSAEDFVSDSSGLPLLRYGREQMMGALIEAQLSRLKIKLGNQFELDSTSSIMALVAQNYGWAITTPSNYARAKRFQADVRLHPFPRKGFARTISVYVGEPQMNAVADSILTALRGLLTVHTITPLTGLYPWLKDSFRLVPE